MAIVNYRDDYLFFCPIQYFLILQFSEKNILVSNFNDIYTAFYRKSFQYVKSYVHDEMAVEDIVTESFIRLWQKIKEDPIEQIGPYLFTILKNRSLDYLKHIGIKKNVHNQISEILNRELDLRTSSLKSSDPNEIFAEEVSAIISQTLNKLPKRTREIFIASRFENKSHKEIAELYNITVKGVDYHILQSVKELRFALKDYLPILAFLHFLK